MRALFLMPKSKPTSTGPMNMQPAEHGSIAPTPLLPMMPTAGEQNNAPYPKKRPTRTEAVLIAKARITRRNSLRKQRQAQKG
jgi:hypothetical protein